MLTKLAAKRHASTVCVMMQAQGLSHSGRYLLETSQGAAPRSAYFRELATRRCGAALAETDCLGGVFRGYLKGFAPAAGPVS